MSDKAYAAFERDIPEHLREGALYAMAAATGGWEDAPNVHMTERDQLDAINWRARGIIEIEGKEYLFDFEDGNRNGAVLLAWEPEGPFERHQAVLYALQPQQNLIDDAIEMGHGKFLIWKWDAVLKNIPELAKIPGKYAYDKFFQPGGMVENYWQEKAAKYQFVIVSEETAKKTRALLENNSENFK